MFYQIYMFFGPKRGFLTLFGSFSGPKKVGISINIFQSFSSKNNFQKGVFVPLWPIFGQNRSRWPTIIPSVILEPYDFQRRVTCLCSNNILKNGKNEVFWGFKRFWGPATGQKRYYFQELKKHLEIYSYGSQKPKICADITIHHAGFRVQNPQ